MLMCYITVNQAYEHLLGRPSKDKYRYKAFRVLLQYHIIYLFKYR